MDAESITTNIRVLRWTMIFWLAGWFVRTLYFIEYLFVYIVRYPVHFDFFPEILQSPDVSIGIYFLPLLALPAVIRPTHRRLIAASLLLIVCSLVSLWHLDTYNDATYVTCFWVSVWMVWVAFNIRRVDYGFRCLACFLAQLIVGMIFMGGAIGKMTPEYLSGEAWSNMFLKQNHYILGVWISQILTSGQIAIFSQILSKGMIFTEFLIGLLPFFPFRTGAIGASVLMVAMLPLTNTLMIFSVVGCLIGMLTGCLFWKPVK
ncbi:MAG: hypothetical protein AB7S78_00680 [Candidatus Omnitrophota bacterium]